MTDVDLHRRWAVGLILVWSEQIGNLEILGSMFGGGF